MSLYNISLLLDLAGGWFLACAGGKDEEPVVVYNSSEEYAWLAIREQTWTSFLDYLVL
jgi:hypothetical protein